MKQAITFFSEGHKLVGDLYTPDNLQATDQRAGIVLCHGYTGVKDLYLPDNARVLNEAGYVVLTFDYKGWGDSEGARSRLAPWSRVADVQAALTFLGLQDGVDAQRLGIYGTSYGGATVVWAAALDERVKCVVSVVGVGDGRRWMRSVRHPDEWHDMLLRAKQDREQRVLSGESQIDSRRISPPRHARIIRLRLAPSRLSTLMRHCLTMPTGWWIRSPHGRCCLLTLTMIVWCQRRNRRVCMTRQASRKSS